jgi:phospholipid/cholesterol/gamma-HCH transport system substrate-binding protein
MKSLLRENIGEALVGLFVIVFAIWFVWFAWGKTGGGDKPGAVHVVALFPNSTGINVGSDVRVAGMKVGTVTSQELDPQSFQVKVKLPADSSAAITSEGFLGATFIALIPGGETVSLKEGDTIADTQGAMDLMGMVGQFINKSDSSAPASKEAAQP